MEVGPNLFHASGPAPRRIKADLVAISVVRDEMWRLPFFLAYHRWLGVEHFIIIDNRSRDGTLDYLRSESDVTGLHAPGAFSGKPHGQISWLTWALGFAPPERWNLLVDADELFVGHALRRGDLRSLVRQLDAEESAIVASTMVDCHAGSLRPSTRPEPNPWHRMPYFDRGPYISRYNADAPIRVRYSGVRERIGWPYWQKIRRLRKLVPSALHPAAFHDAPPRIVKMPLLRNVPGLDFHSMHRSGGAKRSARLLALLHYKLDVDLPRKVDLALRERQYWKGSREYEAYARVLTQPDHDLRFAGTCRFEGARSLIDAGLLSPGSQSDASHGAEPPLAEATRQIWECGDRALQEQVWEQAWGPTRAAEAALL